ncbi:c-type cytochrome [Marinibaculum pumilum]|uniref:C-type cytochrome n=1 Tax=Marinibaculum pumilum TaxID=1766165 RepID=A0ABV7L644_9PROT
MDTFEFNKIAGAILFVLLIIVGIGTVGDILVSPKQLYEPVYHVDVPDAEGAAATAAAPAEVEVAPIAVRLASADVEDGMKEARKCAACHTFEQGGANKVGPNLWDVVGHETAHLDNFSYSDSLASLGATWSFEALDEFLADPKAYVPGTKMAFAGVKNPDRRADLIAYMRSLSESPVPLPEPAPAAAEPAAAEPASGDGAAQPATEDKAMPATDGTDPTPPVEQEPAKD